MKMYWFIFCQSALLLKTEADGRQTIPLAENAPIPIPPHTKIHAIASFPDGTEVRAFAVDAPITCLPRYEMVDLRASYDRLEPALYKKAGKCHEILYWDRHTRYCGICGATMEYSTDISKKCTACGHEIWPQLSTAVIVLIHRGDEVLLVHAKNFRGNFYGLVAGFVETGETLEEAVRREVLEETGLSISHLRYFGSQPWPYPCGLMVGFFAEYAGGSLRLQRSELSAGGWFHKDRLPEIPRKLSIARALIDHWLDNDCNI